MVEEKKCDVQKWMDKKLPVLAVINTVLFPEATVLVRVEKKSGLEVLKKVKETDGYFICVPKRENHDRDVPDPEDLYKIGTVGRLEKMPTFLRSEPVVKAEGIVRVQVSDIEVDGDLVTARGTEIHRETDVAEDTLEALHENIQSVALEILGLIDTDPDFIKFVETIDNTETLVHLCAQNLTIPVEVKQELYEMNSLKGMGLKLLELMAERRENLRLQKDMTEKISQKAGKAQREHILREQLAAIQEELGDGESKTGDYRDQLESKGFPEEVKKVVLEEINKLETMPPTSSETHVVKNYLELLFALPWKLEEEGEIDLDRAREILARDHYGLEKVKKRIVQQLAVMKLKQSQKGSILLLVGPPGVGKTSLGRSVAEALDRKFVRVSLGGVRDEAEIRGHRRTYIGAMTGRIIQGIKRAGSQNPVMVLDEMDKLSQSYQGDPASALLEVLDPEQNENFVDHYLDVPYDLSHVLFIGTANTLDSIPRPLLDRMEVIRISGYTDEEKLQISKGHLVSKQLEKHGLTKDQLEIAEETQLEVIEKYTREAGVRELQRKLAAICRHYSEKIIEPEAQLPLVVESEDLDDALGPQKYDYDLIESHAVPGVVTGLAWTPVGGDILFIESGLMPGKGSLILTGQLGEVMKESAQIALSLVRARLPLFKPEFRYNEHDIHVHVPAGSIPKDGPSAGITMLSSIASLVTGRPVDPKLAMTGEITLRGAVLPVGGIKEKLLAAHRAGIRRVIMSKKNEKDLRDVPEKIREDLQIHFVEKASEVIQLSLGMETLPELPPPAAGHSGPFLPRPVKSRGDDDQTNQLDRLMFS